MWAPKVHSSFIPVCWRLRLQHLLDVVHYFIAGGDVSVCLCCSHTSYFSVVPTVFKNGDTTSSLLLQSAISVWLGTVVWPAPIPFHTPTWHPGFCGSLQLLASIVLPVDCQIPVHPLWAQGWCISPLDITVMSVIIIWAFLVKNWELLRRLA